MKAYLTPEDREVCKHTGKDEQKFLAFKQQLINEGRLALRNNEWVWINFPETNRVHRF